LFLMVGGSLDTEKDPAQIVNLGLPEFASELARRGKEDNSNPAVSNSQLPGREVEVGPFGSACGASFPCWKDS